MIKKSQILGAYPKHGMVKGQIKNPKSCVAYPQTGTLG